MTTKEITEAILYINPGLYKSFKALHIINDYDRNWSAVEHPEYNFILKYFTNPKFLAIIDKQIHIYLIGDMIRKGIYNIINIEGYQSDLLSLKKTELTTHIKDTIKTDLFLPENSYERIIFIKDNQPYIFNKIGNKGKNIFNKSLWSIGTNIYDVEESSYELNGTKILNEIYKEF